MGVNKQELALRSFLAPLLAPKKRLEVGWFVPNSAELRAQLQAIQKNPGKRIAVEALANGPVRFYAEDM